MRMFTVIVSLVIVFAVVMAVRHVRKKGIACSSCPGCPLVGSCSGKCHTPKKKA